MPPTLLSEDEDDLPRDPEQSCRYRGPHLDWYSAGDPDAPSSGWYLGSDWFQPVSLGEATE